METKHGVYGMFKGGWMEGFGQWGLNISSADFNSFHRCPLG